MKVLVIHRPEHPEPDDFCHAIDGELAVTPAIECGNPNCGCDRALIGLNSAQASTTVRVTDLDLDPDDVIRAYEAYLDNYQWSDDIADRAAKYAHAAGVVHFIAGVAALHETGTVLRAPAFQLWRRLLDIHHGEITLMDPADEIPAPHPPVRIQQRRTAGWRKPSGAVSVVRGTRWGNPYRVGVHAADNAEAVQLFIDYLGRNPQLVADARLMLAGKPLMCWCHPDQPCHADIWLQVVNQ